MNTIQNEKPEWLTKQGNALAREARAFEGYKAMCERQGVKVDRRHTFREDGLLIGFIYSYEGKGGKARAWCYQTSPDYAGREAARVDRPNGRAITFRYPEKAKAKAFAIAAGLES